jgi:hypothetical protein
MDAWMDHACECAYVWIMNGHMHGWIMHVNVPMHGIMHVNVPMHGIMHVNVPMYGYGWMHAWVDRACECAYVWLWMAISMD